MNELQKMAEILGVSVEEATLTSPNGDESYGYKLKFEDEPVYIPKNADARTLMALATVTETGGSGASKNYVKAAKAMSYVSVAVDATTLTFTGLNQYTARELREVTDALVLQGTIPEGNYLVDLWRETYNEPKLGLLVLSTVFPIRAYLSLFCVIGRGGEGILCKAMSPRGSSRSRVFQARG